MIKYLILVGLLSICSVSSSDDCVRELKVDVDYKGKVLVHLPAPDAEHCQLLCTEHPQCHFFNFNQGDKNTNGSECDCALMSSSSGKPDGEGKVRGVTSGYSLKPCCPKSKPCLSKVYKNIDFLGESYHSLFTDSPGTCQGLCTKDPYCQFFTYRDEKFDKKSLRYKCEFKTFLAVPYPDIEAKDNAVSGFSDKTEMNTKFRNGCKGKLFPYAEIIARTFRKMEAVGPEHCLALCSAIPKCTYFSFERNTFHCHLKSKPRKMKLRFNKGFTSGLPAYCCLPDDSWLKTQYYGVNFKGSDLSSELIDSPEACQRTCNEEDNCQFYTFFKANYAEEDKRSRCFLKRAINLPVPDKVMHTPYSFSGFARRKC